MLVQASPSVAPVLDTGPVSGLEGAGENLEGGSETCPGEARAPPPAGDTLPGVYWDSPSM